jgi:hypothetical protein
VKQLVRIVIAALVAAATAAILAQRAPPQQINRAELVSQVRRCYELAGEAYSPVLRGAGRREIRSVV